MIPPAEKLMQVIAIQTQIAKLGLDLGGVMQYVVEQTIPLIQADGAAIELAEKGDMVYRAASGIARSQLGLKLGVHESLSGLSVLRGETLSCEDSETDPRVNREACRKIGLRSMIVIPLKYNGVTVGVLKAMASRPNQFTASDETLFGMMAEVLAAAMYFSVKYDIDDLFAKATHDGMTGLANRALFMERLRNSVALAKRGKLSYGVLMIDMDGLKNVNDTYGHRVGDMVIIEFSKRLEKATRETDLAARLGGDEFGILVSSVQSAKDIAEVISRIDSLIQPPVIFEGKSYKLKASIGFALIPQDGEDPEKVLEIADKRMYEVELLHKLG